jgi:hypothetical protein
MRIWNLAYRRAGWNFLVATVIAGAVPGGVAADDQISTAELIGLREAVAAGNSARVRIELKAEGLFQPGLPPDQIREGTKLPKPLNLDVKTRLIFAERIIEVEPGPAGKAEAKPVRGRAKRSVRLVGQAASAINGEVRRSSAVLRPEVSLLVAEWNPADRQSGVVVASPGGPLTRSELELVQGAADSLTMADLLPAEPMAVGSKWKPGEAAARSLSGYDVITANTLEAVLESADGDSARIKVKGKVEGSVLGGPGTITCEGGLTFNRRAGWVERLELNRSESRRPGPVEAGLEVKSTLTLTRDGISTPPELSDDAIGGLDLKMGPERLLLRLASPDGKAVLYHDRNWHITWDDPRVVVLKHLDGGKVDAQCNLAVGPNAGKGKHQDPAQFRDDIRRALGKRFVDFLGMGEVDGDPAGNFRYRVGVQGREGDVGLLWFYYLVAGPEGDQLLATFTVTQEQAKTFREQDLSIIGSLQWVEEKGK